MRSSTKSELQQLRELVWFMFGATPADQATHLAGWKFCCFCRGPLLSRPLTMTFGHRHHPPVNADITLHHKNENREDNDPSNLDLCHDSCHRSHHAKKRALIQKTRKEVIQNRYAERQEERQENHQETYEGVLTRDGGRDGR